LLRLRFPSLECKPAESDSLPIARLEKFSDY
jgi:hypothetical protein